MPVIQVEVAGFGGGRDFNHLGADVFARNSDEVVATPGGAAGAGVFGPERVRRIPRGGVVGSEGGEAAGFDMEEDSPTLINHDVAPIVSADGFPAIRPENRAVFVRKDAGVVPVLAPEDVGVERCCAVVGENRQRGIRKVVRPDGGNLAEVDVALHGGGCLVDGFFQGGGGLFFQMVRGEAGVRVRLRRSVGFLWR